MADKNFKVKSGLNIPITSAAILTTDASGNISSTAVLPITAGGTGQTSATNAINALLPVQNGSTVNYAIQSDGSNVNWGKLYNQTIKNNGTTVTPRGIVNIVGATFADDSGTDTTTITFTDTTGVSTSGGSTITTSSASTKGLIIKGASSQNANLQEWQNNAGAVVTSISATGKITSSVDASINGITIGLGSATSASRNIAIGLYAGESFGVNDQNIAVGYASGRYNYGANNVFVGTQAGYAASGGSGNNNVYLGTQSGYSGVGSGNIMIGYQAGQNTSGSNKLVIANSNTSTPLIGGDFSANALTISGNVNINSQSASTVGLTVKAAASQTANLQEWQNSSGTILAKVDSSGSMFTTTATAGTNTTQVATTAFVKTAIDNLIASAPGTLDTLDEIAQALNDDPNFYTTITTLTNALAEQDSYTLMGVF